MKRILLLIVFLSTQACFIGQSSKDNDKEFNRNISDAFLIFLIQQQLNATTSTLTDNKNGFVTRLEVYNSSGKTKYSYSYKKCLQGQVYRQTQNDCRGIGTSTDVYGATQLQFANDLARNSCKNDITVKSPDGGYISDPISYYQLCRTTDFDVIYDHIPKTLPIWSSGSADVQGYRVYFTVENMQKSPFTLFPNDQELSISRELTDLSSTSKYVLCGGFPP